MLHAALLFALLAQPAAEDAWAKVKELKSGAELRIFRKGSPQPVLAKFDELTAENLIIVLRNEQTAIPRDTIDRIDARPQGGSRVKRESKVTPDDPTKERPDPNRPRRTPGPTGSVSSGVSIGGRPDFETVYRRRP